MQAPGIAGTANVPEPKAPRLGSSFNTWRQVHVTRYQPSTVYSDSIARPACPKCGTGMMLARIEPDIPGHDLGTFECPRCEHSESGIVKLH